MANISATQTCTSTTTPPPPSPCTARPATSMMALTLTAQTSEPPRKIVLAMSMMFFLPNTSESLPQNGTLAAFARRYAEPTHAYSESGIWKDKDIVGRAVGIKTVSRATRKMLSVKAEKQRIVANGGLDRAERSVAVVVVEAFDGRGAFPFCCSEVGFNLTSVVVGDSVWVVVDAPREVWRECDICFDRGNELCDAAAGGSADISKGDVGG
jgi:hypothetical protein